MGSPMSILLRSIVAFTVTVWEKETKQAMSRIKQLVIYGAFLVMNSG
jgi:5,10-methylene-tetrahydrofolate dehydrogenase/methenyl tetrahydrofolate cyclohydrolase